MTQDGRIRADGPVPPVQPAPLQPQPVQPLRLPAAVPAGTDVFQLALDLGAPVPEADWRLLSDDEGVRALRYRQHADKVRFARSRATLRRLLARRLQASPERLVFVDGPHGKPALAGAGVAAAAPHFNVSHAGSFVLIALSAVQPVGVDIERRDPVLDTAALVDQAWSPLERQASAQAAMDFYERWTAKEAVLKALGLGVAEHLQRLSVLAATGDRYGLRHAGMAWPALEACRLPAPGGYAAALAWVGVP